MGGGAPFQSELYNTDEFLGENRFGNMATRYRDLKIKDILKESTPNFLNDYFVNVAERTCGKFDMDDHVYNELYSDVHSNFDVVPPMTEDMYIYMTGMDMNTSSCIPGINMKMCKAAMDAVPNRFRHLFANSLFLGQFPSQWTNAYVTLLPKTGNKTSPGKWRPISKISIIFAKIIEKIVHKQLLNYFVENNILTELQFRFLPN